MSRYFDTSTLALALLLLIVLVFIVASRAYLIWGELRSTEHKRRRWMAASPSGSVLLGESITYEQALARASKLGTVSYTDTEHAIIFFDTHRGGSAPAQPEG